MKIEKPSVALWVNMTSQIQRKRKNSMWSSFFLAGLDVGVGVSFVMGKPSLLIYLRLNHTMNGEEGKGLWEQGL